MRSGSDVHLAMTGMFEGRWTPVKGVRGASGKRGAGVAHGVGGGSRAIATRARRRGPAGRTHRSSGAAACTASRRRGRRSGPLTRLWKVPCRAGIGGRRGRSGGRRRFPPPSPRGAHPTAEPCLPARAGVRGRAPGCGTPARSRAPAHPAAGAMPSATSRNSARRAAWTRRAASRSVSAFAAASSSWKSTPGLRCPSAPSRERNLA